MRVLVNETKETVRIVSAVVFDPWPFAMSAVPVKDNTRFFWDGVWYDEDNYELNLSENVLVKLSNGVYVVCSESDFVKMPNFLKDFK